MKKQKTRLEILSIITSAIGDYEIGIENYDILISDTIKEISLHYKFIEESIKILKEAKYYNACASLIKKHEKLTKKLDDKLWEGV